MALYTAIELDSVEPSTEYQAPREVTGVRWSKKVSPDDYPLWLVESELEDGATFRWDGQHGDDVLYVFEGGLRHVDRRCPPDGAVIVESGVTAELVAVGPTRVAHFGAVEDEPPSSGRFGPPEAEGHGVHVVGPRGQFFSGAREGVHATWYADATCATCRAQLLKVHAGPQDKRNGPPHHHTEDEIIYLIEGTVRIGKTVFTPKTSLSIPGMARYALTGGPEGHTFLNYRRDVSEQVYDRDDPALLETGLSRGGHETGDLITA